MKRPGILLLAALILASGAVGLLWNLRGGQPAREIVPAGPPDVVRAENSGGNQKSRIDEESLRQLLASYEASVETPASTDGRVTPPEAKPGPKVPRKVPVSPSKLLRLDPKSKEGQAIVLQLIQSPLGARILLSIPTIRNAVQDMLNSPATLEEFRQFLKSEEMKKFREKMVKSQNGSKAADVLAEDPLIQELMNRLDLKTE